MDQLVVDNFSISSFCYFKNQYLKMIISLATKFISGVACTRDIQCQSLNGLKCVSNLCS